MIDLHTHTTASDGRCTPEDLVARAVAAGVTVLSVTDHDTLAGNPGAKRAAAQSGIAFVPGVEISAVLHGRDVHVLGYFMSDPDGLDIFLLGQRRSRIDRAREIAARLNALGMPIDGDAIVNAAREDSSRSVGRPAIARAMVAAGHVSDVAEAFDRWLAAGRPAFVPRRAASPNDVFDQIHAAGGLASIAHPGLLARDEWLRSFVDAGADAIEAYHAEHDERETAKYLRFAVDAGIGVSGGSDYHAAESHGGGGPGSTSLPAPAFEDLRRRVRR